MICTNRLVINPLEDCGRLCSDCTWVLSFDCCLTRCWMFQNYKHLRVNSKLCTRCVREQVTSWTKILVFHGSSDGGRSLKLHLHTSKEPVCSGQQLFTTTYNHNPNLQLSLSADPAWAASLIQGAVRNAEQQIVPQTGARCGCYICSCGSNQPAQRVNICTEGFVWILSKGLMFVSIKNWSTELLRFVHNSENIFQNWPAFILTFMKFWNNTKKEGDVQGPKVLSYLDKDKHHNCSSVDFTRQQRRTTRHSRDSRTVTWVTADEDKKNTQHKTVRSSRSHWILFLSVAVKTSVLDYFLLNVFFSFFKYVLFFLFLDQFLQDVEFYSLIVLYGFEWKKQNKNTTLHS